MVRGIKRPSAPPGLTAGEKAELGALLSTVPPFPSLPVRDIGDEASPELIAALEFVESCGVRTGAAFRAYAASGRSWLIDSRILEDLERLAS